MGCKYGNALGHGHIWWWWKSRSEIREDQLPMTWGKVKMSQCRLFVSPPRPGIWCTHTWEDLNVCTPRSYTWVKHMKIRIQGDRSKDSRKEDHQATCWWGEEVPEYKDRDLFICISPKVCAIFFTGRQYLCGWYDGLTVVLKHAHADTGMSNKCHPWFLCQRYFEYITCWRGPLLAHGNYKSSLSYFCVYLMKNQCACHKFAGQSYWILLAFFL